MPVLIADNVSKHFGQVQALRRADVEVHAGEILGIVGDNGAGKSTLLKLLSGIHQPSSGQIAVEGQPVDFRSPAEARAAGISTVHQDLALVEVLDVATNLHLGDFPRKGLLVDRRRMERDATALLNRLGVRVKSVLTPVGELSGGQRQILSISRAVRMESARIVLLDEPTAALGVQETKHVGHIIDGLRNDGKAIVLISHDLEFVFEYADRIQVLRLGQTTRARRTGETTRDEIVGLITGTRNDR